ncbi:MAG: Fic family protein [Bacteroidota bacterium]
MISDLLKKEFVVSVDFNPMVEIKKRKAEQLPVDYFDFYNAVSSVYSSKIEGEEIDFDSFFKHKFLMVNYNPDYTKKSEDLFKAYEFIQNNPLTADNVFEAHNILSEHLLPTQQRGRVRNNPMFVINEEDRIEYVACEPNRVEAALDTFFSKADELVSKNLSVVETFFYAAQIHLVFVKIHPFQDGNGRTARLLEKWFLIMHLGKDAVAVDLEKNYYKNRKHYYDNIRKLGLEYQNLDWSKALDFLKMTIFSLKGTK